jgi:nucleoporin NUP159
MLYTVSSLAWLENLVFLSIHTTTNESPPSSVYHIITKQPPSTYGYQKISDPVDPFGSDKLPHHSILRLKDFPPNLQDLLIVSSTASPDIGLLSRSKSPLAADKPADSIVNVFTTTELADDSKRATLPMSEEMDNTIPIGIALDLSSKDKVYKPIPADEIEESPGPIPGFWALNHEGVLSAWWVIYTESIRHGTTYPQMVNLDGMASAPAPAQPNAFSSPAPASAFGSPATATPSPFGSTTTAKPAFGNTTAFGAKPSPWGSAPAASAATTGGATFGHSAFGSSPSASAPSFGKPTSIGFGQSSMLGMRSSPWATASTASATPAFGQSGFGGTGSSANKGAFGSSAASTPAPASGGFASFASQGGFSSLSGGNNSSGNIFESKPAKSNFTTNSSDLAMETETAFPVQKQQGGSAGGLFGSQPFKLNSSFKADPSAKDDDMKPSDTTGGSLFGSNFGSALGEAAKQPLVTPSTKDEDMDAEEPQESSQVKPTFGLASTTPATTPAPAKFGTEATAPPKTGIFGLSSTSGSGFSSIFNSVEPAKPTTSSTPAVSTPEIKLEPSEKNLSDIPLPPESTSRLSYPLGESSSSSGTADQSFDRGKTPAKEPEAPLPPDFTTAPALPMPPDFLTTPTATPKPTKPVEDAPLPPNFVTPLSKSAADAPLPPDFIKTPSPAVAEKPAKGDGDDPLPPDFLKMPRQPLPDAPVPPAGLKPKPLPRATDAPLPPDFLPKLPSKEPSAVPSLPSAPDSADESDLGESDGGSEGSGIDVEKDLKDMSPSTTGMTQTPGFTPQSSFGGMGGSTFSTSRPELERPRGALFGEISRNAPVFAQPTYPTSPRSPSPVRGAVPSRVLRPEAPRSVSAPGMASQILGAKKSQTKLRTSIVANPPPAEDPFIVHQRKAKEKQELEERQPLVDEEDEQIQEILSADIEASLVLDEFIAHSNVVPPAKESIPAQVEAVYRDINSMIDTLGLNARAVTSFIKGHIEQFKESGRQKEDLEIPDDWVLCEVEDLGEVLDQELVQELEEGRAQDVEGKIEACQELARDLSRLRAKQQDLHRIVMAKVDPEQLESSKSRPLTAEQAAQQNDLRREFTNFSKLLAEAEEALTILKARIASASSASGRGGANVPTVDALMRTITKMTSMVEKRSGDIDVLENQMRKLRFSSTSREGSPMVTPQKKAAFSPEPVTGGTPRNFRHSLTSSVTSFGARGTPPRKKVSGFSKEEKNELMEKKAKRQAVLDKLQATVGKHGVTVWAMDDIE